MQNNYPNSRHAFCKKKYIDEHSACLSFYEKQPVGFSICPYGFTCYKKNDGKTYCGYKVLNHFDEKKINGHEKHSSGRIPMTIFTENDFLYYVVNDTMNKEFYELKEVHEIYRSTIHDIKRAISSIRDVVQEIDSDNDEKTIIDGYDLISTRLDYHDRIVMKNKATQIFGKIKPHKMIKKLKILLEYKASTRNISFDFIGNPCIEIYDDSKAIFILFFVIMENAVKYAPLNSKIVVRFKDLGKYKTSVSFENVCNDLTNDDLLHIFDRGVRGPNTEEKSGNGIGLSIAKEIMEEYHIFYNVSLKEDGITNWFCFYMEIPSLNKNGEVFYL